MKISLFLFILTVFATHTTFFTSENIGTLLLAKPKIYMRPAEKSEAKNSDEAQIAQDVGDFLEKNYKWAAEGANIQQFIFTEAPRNFKNLGQENQKKLQEFETFAKNALTFLRLHKKSIQKRPQLTKDVDSFMESIGYAWGTVLHYKYPSK